MCAHLSQLLSYVCYELLPFGSHGRCTLWEQDMCKGCLRRKIDSSLRQQVLSCAPCGFTSSLGYSGPAHLGYAVFSLEQALHPSGTPCTVHSCNSLPASVVAKLWTGLLCCSAEELTPNIQQDNLLKRAG